MSFTESKPYSRNVNFLSNDVQSDPGLLIQIYERK